MAPRRAGTELTWDQVRYWRLQRQMLDRPTGVGTAGVVARLAGVQAQVMSSAEQAIAVRLAGAPAPDDTVSAALRARRIVRTWGQRGTLHLLTAQDAPAYLSLLAAARTWEKAPWQRTFATAAQVEEIAQAAVAVLDGAVLTREELAAEIVERTGNAALAGKLSSGWGAILKPLAWQGLLCNASTDGTAVTFTSPASWLPAWPGLPAPADAAAVVIPAYLGAYGPATPAIFDQWLLRGMSRKADLQAWFAALLATGTISEVTVEGAARYARTADLDALAAARPNGWVRLLPAFDQFVLGPGTTDEQVVAPGRRALISKAAGWISPVLVAAGRVAGTWAVQDETLAVTVFTEAGPVDGGALDAEVAVLQRVLGRSLTLTTSTG